MLVVRTVYLNMDKVRYYAVIFKLDQNEICGDLLNIPKIF